MGNTIRSAPSCPVLTHCHRLLTNITKPRLITPHPSSPIATFLPLAYEPSSRLHRPQHLPYHPLDSSSHHLDSNLYPKHHGCSPCLLLQSSAQPPTVQRIDSGQARPPHDRSPCPSATHRPYSQDHLYAMEFARSSSRMSEADTVGFGHKT